MLTVRLLPVPRQPVTRLLLRHPAVSLLSNNLARYVCPQAYGEAADALALQPMAGYHRDCEHQARQALGEAAFQAAYHRGLELPAADAVAYALQQPPDKPPAPAVSERAPLTARELQVARLVAAGRSNKDIAAELVISQRTAENHVEHILTKLGFTSRAQVAAWVAASQPDGDGRLAAPGVQASVV